MLTFFALVLWPGSHVTPTGPSIPIVELLIVAPDVDIILVDPSSLELTIVSPA